VDRRRHERNEVSERDDGFPVVEIIREGMAVGDVDDLALLHDHHELVRVLHGQRLQEEGADNGEDAGVDADAEGEGQDGDGGETGLLADAAECLAEIVEHRSPLLAYVSVLRTGGEECSARRHRSAGASRIRFAAPAVVRPSEAPPR
jgi:hypothetical protein